jgi:predicted AlkP superfamily pyrophosphatase or phosphodiesterase
MRPVVVIAVVGLAPRLLGENTPNLNELARVGGARPLQTVWPALTCSVQTTFLTGLLPRHHGIVGNGWYFRDLSEIWLWRQSNRLVSGERLWEVARGLDDTFTCANLCWWYNMYGTMDIGVTPRPMYPADGRKIPDCYTKPGSLRDELTARLGRFPLFQFWGPGTDISSSAWIANAALYVCRSHHPTLTLIYLPHLDYCLQRFGPSSSSILKDVRQVDSLCGEIIREARKSGTEIIVLSEYGITDVSLPIHINRALRDKGFLTVREELGLEQLDPGASAAFAVADHQIAHVYVADKVRVPEVKSLVESVPGVERVIDEEGKRQFGLNHERSGELIAFARADAWFTYYYWTDDTKAPDYARTVDIHRKPGYDPVELFLDPELRWPKLAIASRLARRSLGLRTLMDVIPLDATLVKGSHGRLCERAEDGPLVMSSRPDLLPTETVPATGIKSLILKHLFDDEHRGRWPWEGGDDSGEIAGRSLL